jgi:hypothetical protein
MVLSFVSLSLLVIPAQAVSKCRASTRLRRAGYFLALPQKVTKKV